MGRALLQRIKQEGDGGVVHGLRGPPSNRKLAKTLKRRVVEVFAKQKRAKQWHDYGPTLAVQHDSREENLRQLRHYIEQHGRPVSYTDKASLFQIAPRAVHHRDVTAGAAEHSRSKAFFL
jgi:hypothetical protein